MSQLLLCFYYRQRRCKKTSRPFERSTKDKRRYIRLKTNAIKHRGQDTRTRRRDATIPFLARVNYFQPAETIPLRPFLRFRAPSNHAFRVIFGCVLSILSCCFIPVATPGGVRGVVHDRRRGKIASLVLGRASVRWRVSVINLVPCGAIFLGRRIGSREPRSCIDL